MSVTPRGHPAAGGGGGGRGTLSIYTGGGVPRHIQKWVVLGMGTTQKREVLGTGTTQKRGVLGPGGGGGGGGALTYMSSTGMCRSKDPLFYLTRA